MRFWIISNVILEIFCSLVILLILLESEHLGDTMVPRCWVPHCSKLASCLSTISIRLGSIVHWIKIWYLYFIWIDFYHSRCRWECGFRFSFLHSISSMPSPWFIWSASLFYILYNIKHIRLQLVDPSKLCLYCFRYRTYIVCHFCFLPCFLFLYF